MSKLNSLSDLLVLELQDLHHAENQLVKALPRLAAAAVHEELQIAFAEHLEQTRQHVVRVERTLEILGAPTKGKKCKAMQGLIAESDEIIADEAPSAIRDAALITAAQRIEHYEIAGYGGARTFARLVGQEEVAGLLQQTLDEEGAADKRLTMLAETINVEAGMVSQS